MWPPTITATSFVPSAEEVIESQLRDTSDVFCTHVFPEPCEGQRKIKIEAVSIDNLVFHLKKEHRQFHFERELCIFDKKKV